MGRPKRDKEMTEDEQAEREQQWQYLNSCWMRLYNHERALRKGGQVVGSIYRDYSAVKHAQQDLGLDEQLPYERAATGGENA